MNIFLDTLFVIMILTTLAMMGSSRLMTCIRIMAVQGIAIGIVVWTSCLGIWTTRILLIGTAVICLKGFVFPYLLSRAMRESNTNHETNPMVGYVPSLLIGVIILGGSFWLTKQVPLPITIVSNLAIPVSFALLTSGLFLIIARRTALQQVLGYLVMENGIFTFGFSVVSEIPALVEIGVLLDVFVAVFVMGIAIYRIQQEFDHMDSDQLTNLKG